MLSGSVWVCQEAYGEGFPGTKSTATLHPCSFNSAEGTALGDCCSWGQGKQHVGTADPGDKATELVLLVESSREGTQNSSDFSEV